MMTDLFEKSIATLELPRVLEQLAACASTHSCRLPRPSPTITRYSSFTFATRPSAKSR